MKVSVPDEILPAEQLGRVHFVGIGGAGLSGIARIMLGLGVRVSGSDQTDSEVLAGLRAAGADVHLGHRADNLAALQDGDTLVVSTAVPEDNPEYLEARRRGLRVWPRSAALASVMSGHRTVAVAGTHGKTTTTSMLTQALQAAGADPTYAIGGTLTQTGLNAALGSGEIFVAEADESDGAFLVYSPAGAIVTNIDADHLDQWGTEEAYQQAFVDFLDRITPGGFLVTWAGSPTTRALAERAAQRGLRVFTYAAEAGPGVDYTPADLAITLQVPGEHYVLDALAAFIAGVELGADPARLRQGLAGFGGTQRRMELKGEASGVRVYDSYAHHPVEIAGDLQAARSIVGKGRLIVAFQPHLVSRTKIFGAQMGQELSAADQVVVTDIYLAREAADPEITGRLVAESVQLAETDVEFVPELSDVAAALVRRAAPGDLVLTLGAGSITSVGPVVLELLERS